MTNVLKNPVLGNEYGSRKEGSIILPSSAASRFQKFQRFGDIYERFYFFRSRQYCESKVLYNTEVI